MALLRLDPFSKETSLYEFLLSCKSGAPIPTTLGFLVVGFVRFCYHYTNATLLLGYVVPGVISPASPTYDGVVVFFYSHALC